MPSIERAVSMLRASQEAAFKTGQPMQTTMATLSPTLKAGQTTIGGSRSAKLGSKSITPDVMTAGVDLDELDISGWLEQLKTNLLASLGFGDQPTVMSGGSPNLPAVVGAAAPAVVAGGALATVPTAGGSLLSSILAGLGAAGAGAVIAEGITDDDLIPIIPEFGDFGTSILDVLSGGGLGGNGIPSNWVAYTWDTGTAKFYRLIDGRIAVQRKNGVWKVYRPKKHIVISSNPRIGTFNRAAKRFDRLEKRLTKKVYVRRK